MEFVQAKVILKLWTQHLPLFLSDAVLFHSRDWCCCSCHRYCPTQAIWEAKPSAYVFVAMCWCVCMSRNKMREKKHACREIEVVVKSVCVHWVCVWTETESKKYVFGCYSSPLGGGIRTGLAARNEFTAPDLPETISLCGLHTFGVATRPRWASAHHTQLLKMANEIPNTFYKTHAFYLFLFIPCSFPLFFFMSHTLSLCLSVSFLFLVCVPVFHSHLFSAHQTQLHGWQK